MASQLGNEPAFPFSQHTEVAQTTQHTGLTKREIAAIAAMQGVLAGDGTAGWSTGDVAKHATACADALLAALAGGAK